MGYDSLDELRANGADNNEYDAAYVQELFAQRGGRITGIESAWRRKDGSIVQVRESALATYDDQGRPIDYEGMIEAITQPEPAKLPVTQDVPDSV